MSTLKVNTLEEATAGGATFFTAKAWVNFNGTGTVAIQNDGNVSSITDVTTGKYTVNYSTAVPYAVHSTTMSSIQSGFNMQANCTPRANVSSTTTTASVGTGNSINATFADMSNINFVALS